MIHQDASAVIVGISIAGFVLLLLLAAGGATIAHWWANRPGHRRVR